MPASAREAASDLDLAIATGAGLVNAARTVVVTTVGEKLQVEPAGTIPTAAHDIHVDLVVTPDRTIRCPRPRARTRPRSAGAS